MVLELVNKSTEILSLKVYSTAIYKKFDILSKAI